MHVTKLFTAVACLGALGALAKEPPKDLRIGVKFRPETCEFRSQQGDELVMYVRRALTQALHRQALGGPQV